MAQLAHSNNFIFSFDRIKDAVFHLKTANIPSVAIGSIVQPTPVLDYPLPGDKISYGGLAISFLVDEDFKNYRSVLNWLMQMGPLVRDGNNERPKDKDVMSDATLTILNNSKVPVAEIKYKDCFPQNLGDIQYDYSAGDSTPITCDLTIEFSYFEFVSLSDPII